MATLEQHAALSILRAADMITQEAASVLKPFDLTGAQFNVLRILKGSPDGLPCGQISDRMIQRDPDITRLLDRMESRNLVFRQRSEQDRRVVTTRISEYGMALLERVNPLMHASHQRQFNSFGEEQIREIVELMSVLLRDA